MAELVRDSQATVHTVTCRKGRWCDGFSCQVRIRPGEEYVRSVVFPRHDANGGTTPWVMAICPGCHTRYGREMPPRRTRRAKKRSTPTASDSTPKG